MAALKLSTALSVTIGPFLDDTDGKTPETALTITQPDIRLSKNGAAWAQKSAAQTLTHQENGWYQCALSTTDTDTLGVLTLAVAESGALPIWHIYTVLPANVYDSLILGTDALDVSLIQWLGTAPLALTAQRVETLIGAIAANMITTASIADDAITAAKIAPGAIDAATFAAGAVNAAALASDAVDEIWSKAMTEISAVPGVTASVLDAVRWLFLLSRNRIVQSATSTTLRNDADSTNVGVATVSDDTTNAVRGKFT